MLPRWRRASVAVLLTAVSSGFSRYRLETIEKQSIARSVSESALTHSTPLEISCLLVRRERVSISFSEAEASDEARVGQQPSKEMMRVMIDAVIYRYLSEDMS